MLQGDSGGLVVSDATSQGFMPTLSLHLGLLGCWHHWHFDVEFPY